MESVAPVLALLLGAFSAVASASAAALERSAVSPGSNPAVLALLEAAEQDLNAKRPEQASMLLERALGIEPRNPAVWHYLALARLEQGNVAQAEAMAAKSRSLAEGDRALRARTARPAAGAALQTPSRAVTRTNDARRERPARRAEIRARSLAEHARRQFRRYGSNEPARRQH